MAADWKGSSGTPVDSATHAQPEVFIILEDRRYSVLSKNNHFFCSKFLFVSLTLLKPRKQIIITQRERERDTEMIKPFLDKAFLFIRT
jgi:hypothetical protein